MRVLHLAVALGLAVGSAQAATLDFSGDICGGPCVDRAAIAADYGSIPGQLQVSYTRDVNATAPNNQLLFWTADYSELVGVAYGGVGGRPEIFLEPEAGFEVTLLDFRLGAWPNTNRATQVSVLDGLGGTLFASEPSITISGQASSRFIGPWTSENGIRIQWGPDGFNVGIDEVRFAVSAIDGDPTPIPLPAPLALLATGVLGLVGLRGRNRRA